MASFFVNHQRFSAQATQECSGCPLTFCSKHGNNLHESNLHKITPPLDDVVNRRL